MTQKKRKKVKTFNEIEEINIVDEIKIGDKPKMFIKTPFKLTEKQIELVKLIQNENTNIVFVEGACGTGKSFSAILGALQLFNNNDSYEKIIYIRSIVESADKSIGALPGNLKEKTAPFAAPLFDKMVQLLDEKMVKELFSTNQIEFSPINFLRGEDWKNRIIILDEAQDLSLREIETVMTRIGKNTKLIICGDSRQSDIGRKSGFLKVMNVFESAVDSKRWGIESFQFTIDDIVRSPFLKFIVEKFDEIKSQN